MCYSDDYENVQEKEKSKRQRQKETRLLMPGPYSEKQKKIAKVAPPFDKITAADFKKLRDSKRRKKQ